MQSQLQYTNGIFQIRKKIIVNNVPTHKAIDFIDGNTYYFAGDSELIPEGLLQNFHLKPVIVSFMLHKKADDEFPIFQKKNFFQFYNKRIVKIDSAINYIPVTKEIDVDYIVISKKSKTLYT